MVSRKIISWYKINKRDLPWRKTKNPYFIWLSEVILQQTRVQQGLPYYSRFISRFPTIKDLAEAEEETVLRIWQGLGYYSRARNLHKTAKFIHENLSGQFPETYEKLISLPGIGPYTAAAISSIAFNEARAVVDGNVYRVLSRIYEIGEPIDTGKGIKLFSKLANELISDSNPSDFNQGIMELGATVCLPKTPECSACPVNTECFSRQSGKMLNYPVKKGKTKIRTRHFHYIVLRFHDTIYFQKRAAQDIWNGLYEFFLIESETQIDLPDLLRSNLSEDISKAIKNFSKKSSEKHILSHQRIEATFWLAELDHLPHSVQNHFYSAEQIFQLPKSRLVDRFLLNFRDNNLTLTI
jgi:A/G-specific adenine glycosylase